MNEGAAGPSTPRPPIAPWAAVVRSTRTGELAVLRRDGAENGANETSAAILQAARELVRTHGYDGLTIEDVRTRAGVSRATFYFYFRNKKHLFIHVARSVMEELYALAGRHYPGKDEYTRIVLANASYLAVWQRERAVLGTFFALSLVDGEVGHIYAQFREVFEERIAGRIARLVQQERIPDVNPARVAAALSAMVEFSAYRFFCMDEDRLRHDTEFEDLVMLVSENWYRSVYAAPAPAAEDYRSRIAAAAEAPSAGK